MIWSRLKKRLSPTGHSEGKKEEELDRRKDGNTKLEREHEWTLQAQLGQLKSGQGRRGLLRSHLWGLDDLARLLG